jgi:haloalkane dehalogenase
VVATVQDYSTFMSETDLPKLFVNAEPGAVLSGRQREHCRGWKNQTKVSVSGLHYMQEDSGPENWSSYLSVDERSPYVVCA